MASASTPPAADPDIGTSATASEGDVERALFTLLKPLKAPLNGSDGDIRDIGMRAFGADDLPLLDEYLGKPIALARQLVSILCGLTIEQVHRLDIDDFIMLASDALWQVTRLSIDLGLPPHFFLQPRAEGEAA